MRFRPAAFLALFALCAALLSCGKTPVRSARRINPEFMKLSRVFSVVSAECRDSVPDGSPSEMINDIHRVVSSGSRNFLSSSEKNADLIPLSARDEYGVSSDGILLRKAAEKSLREMGKKAKDDGVSLVVAGACDDGGCAADFCDGFVWLSENAPSFGWAKLPFENGARFRFIGKEACAFCDKWFGGSVPLMIEFVSAWKSAS